MTPRRSNLRTALPLLASATLLALTGCSGSSDGKSGTPEESPIEKYLSAMWDSEEWTQERMDKQHQETEKIVAACMSDEGFEYSPQTNSGAVVFQQDDFEWRSVKFAKEYGYGIVAWPGDNPDDDSAQEEMTDPNQGYIDALSESERNAYYEALYGPSPSEEEMLAMEESDEGMSYNWETAGCYGKAQQEVNGDDAASKAYEDPEFADLFAEINELYTVTYGTGDAPSSDPEVRKLDEAWAACMAKKGDYDFQSPTMTQNALFNEYSELSQTDDVDGESAGPDKGELEKFKQREIEVAVADAECREDTSYDEKLSKIQFAAEEKFIEENRGTLDAMLAKYATKKKS